MKKYSFLLGITLMLFSFIPSHSVQAETYSFVSKDIIALPRPPTKNLTQLQKDCVLNIEKLAYLQAQKSCLLLLTKIKTNKKENNYTKNIRLCGFYIGLLTQRLKLSPHQQQAHSIADLITTLNARSQFKDRLRNEDNFLIMLKSLNITVNIETSCKKAAFQNSGYAMEVLGDYYEELGDYDNAIYWYRRAIETYTIMPQHGGLSAAYALGTLLALSPQPTRHPKKAAYRLLQSITIGDNSFIETYFENNCKNCLPLQTRLSIQRLLKQQGLYSGYIDGDFGSITVKAIMKLHKNPDRLMTPSQ